MLRMSEFFPREQSPEAYARDLAIAYNSGFRVYDPSFAGSRDPAFEPKLYRFAPIATSLQIRHTLIAGRKHVIAAPDEGGDLERDLARVIGQCVSNIDDFTPARVLLARADVSGARFAKIDKREITATYGDGKARRWIVPVRLKDMDKRNFRWATDREDDTTRARLQFARKKTGSIQWVDVPRHAPLISHVVGNSESSLHHGEGLRDALYFLYQAMTRVFEADVRAAERLGHGWLVMKLASTKDSAPTITNTDLVTTAKAELKKMRADNNFVLGEGDALEFLAPPSSSSEWMGKLFERLVLMADRLVMAGSLYAGGPTDSKGGYAQAETEAETGWSVFSVLADSLAGSLTRCMVTQVVRDNWPNIVELGLDGAQHPVLTMDRGRKADPREAAERLEIVLRSGIKVKADQAYDLLDLEQPGPDDEVLETPPAQTPGFSFPGMRETP